MTPIIVDVESLAIEGVQDHIEPVTSAPDNYKKPEAIAKYIAEANANLIEKAALDVDLARIICLGIQRDGHTVTFRCPDEDMEGLAIETLWSQYHHDDVRYVTFNGLRFDLPLLLRRSLYLNIKAPYISCDRYRHPQQIDLYSLLSTDGKAHGLQFYLNRFGYPKGGPDITGAEIAARYQAGDWDAIEGHCRKDVEGTAWLAERINAIPKRQTPADGFIARATSGAF